MSAYARHIVAIVLVVVGHFVGGDHLSWGWAAVLALWIVDSALMVRKNLRLEADLKRARA